MAPPMFSYLCLTDLITLSLLINLFEHRLSKLLHHICVVEIVSDNATICVVSVSFLPVLRAMQCFSPLLSVMIANSKISMIADHPGDYL